MRLTNFFLYILFFSLPLLHAQFLGYFGIENSSAVSGTFEFTKTFFFEFLVFFIFTSFAVELYIEKKKIEFPKQLLIPSILLAGYLVFNTIFSLTPIESLFGSTQKGHGLLMWISISLLAIVLYNVPKKFLKKLLEVAFLSLGFVIILSIKELYSPSFDYGALSERAFGTLGHPNYLACYIIIFLPFLLRKKGSVYKILLLGSIVALLLTKSIWGIFLGSIYLYSFFFLRKKLFSQRIIFLSIGTTLFLGCVFCLFVFQIFPGEKLHSFLSRFYIWETTFHIIFSSPKLFFLGGGLESLPYYFSSFKVPEMYLYENFGFTADRVHSIFFAFFYHLGIIGVMFIGYFLSRCKNIFQEVIPKYRESIFLFLAFGLFHFFSITSYIVILLFLALAVKHTSIKNRVIPTWSILFLCILSFAITYSSLLSYQAEIYASQGNYPSAYKTFPKTVYLSEYSLLTTGNSPLFYKNQIQNLEKVPENCNTLTQKFPSVENLFYCGSILEKLGYDLPSRESYDAGLQKLPDIWNADSPYWDNFFIKNTISGNRFFSEKFSDVRKILEKMNY